MNKHTKGPWKGGLATHHTTSGDRIDPKDDTYFMVVAGLGYYDDKEGEGFGLSGHMSAADNRLLTAAPEMYDMLQGLKHGTPPTYDSMIALLNKIDNG